MSRSSRLIPSGYRPELARANQSVASGELPALHDIMVALSGRHHNLDAINDGLDVSHITQDVQHVAPFVWKADSAVNGDGTVADDELKPERIQATS